MCELCFDDEPVAHGETGVITPAVMRRIREIEAAMPGESVPDAAWDVFFGTSSGSLLWAHHERMAACRTEALAASAATIQRSNVKEAVLGRAWGKVDGTRAQR